MQVKASHHLHRQRPSILMMALHYLTSARALQVLLVKLSKISSNENVRLLGSPQKTSERIRKENNTRVHSYFSFCSYLNYISTPEKQCKLFNDLMLQHAT